MCFVAVLFQTHPTYPVIVAANRNESRFRASREPYRWPGEPAIWAGRDEVAGGTWLGVNSQGLLVAITNRRGGPTDATLPSRGLLCLEALRQPSPAAAWALVEGRLQRSRYNPFNLLCANPSEGWVGTWRGDVQPLTPGFHVLTNLGDLDDETIPMVQRARAAAAELSASGPLEGILASLGRMCADTTPPEPICRVGGATGTVSSTLIALTDDGAVRAYRHADGPPSERPYGDVAIGPV